MIQYNTSHESLSRSELHVYLFIYLFFKPKNLPRQLPGLPSGLRRPWCVHAFVRACVCVCTSFFVCVLVFACCVVKSDLILGRLHVKPCIHSLHSHAYHSLLVNVSLARD